MFWLQTRCCAARARCSTPIRRTLMSLLVVWLVAGPSAVLSAATATCDALSPQPLLPKDPQACRALADKLSRPSALSLDAYQDAVNAFLGQYCHRDKEAGWVRDKGVRDTGPYIANLDKGQWSGRYFGTHAPVVVWYSPSAFAWLKKTRPPGTEARPEDPPPPDGAMLVKEMFPAPAAACAGIEPERLRPTSGAAIAVRDAQGSHDGWFWGWYGFPTLQGQSTFTNDWPAQPGNRLPYMGFGQYCVNCHASAANSSTFASLRNIQDQPGRSIVYLSQSFLQGPLPKDRHAATGDVTDDPKTVGGPPGRQFQSHFRNAYARDRFPPVSDLTHLFLPSQTYDNVWVKPGASNAASQFVTSDQCLGCHAAGSTGLQFDMTRPNPHAGRPGQAGLINDSPYGAWSSSPMGLAGRDPFFFAQLASEVQTFHKEQADAIQGICLGCHGVQGARQFAIDQRADGKDCRPFTRDMVQAVPYPPGNPGAAHANYGALARDGVGCLACHRMLVGEAGASALSKPENGCIPERQALLNPDNRGLARTFTGSYVDGPPSAVFGPFAQPKTQPMRNALNMEPKHHPAIKTSEVCASCHTVRLPVFHRGRVLGHVYEQTTYPEWAFSAYRSGVGPAGEPLPLGAGSKPQSCQQCHMPSTDAGGQPVVGKIASIQEYSNFPQTDHTLGPNEIDLAPRTGVARHTLVGLNLFLVKIAQQFPDVLGIRTQDPMLGDKGVPPLQETENQILAQAAKSTAQVRVDKLSLTEQSLEVRVTVTNLSGHKFPSGVGFRRAFLTFRVVDASGRDLWVSGRTDANGMIIDAQGRPVAGERWWTPDCVRVTGPTPRAHQPHHQAITRQNQAQIYQELVSAPEPSGAGQCGFGATPAGELSTSFLSVCARVKDNRILPEGYLGLEDRVAIAKALGAGQGLAEEAGSLTDDPDYASGGRDTLVYRVPRADLKGARPAAVQATLYYQATPPFYLQDRFCTARGPDTERLYNLVGRLNLTGTPAEGWKLKVVQTPLTRVP